MKAEKTLTLCIRVPLTLVKIKYHDLARKCYARLNASIQMVLPSLRIGRHIMTKACIISQA